MSPKFIKIEEIIMSENIMLYVQKTSCGYMINIFLFMDQTEMIAFHGSRKWSYFWGDSGFQVCWWECGYSSVSWTEIIHEICIKCQDLNLFNNIKLFYHTKIYCKLSFF